MQFCNNYEQSTYNHFNAGDGRIGVANLMLLSCFLGSFFIVARHIEVGERRCWIRVLQRYVKYG